MLKADTYHVTRHRADVVTNQYGTTSETGPRRNLQRPRRAQEKQKIRRNHEDTGQDQQLQTQVASTSDRRPVARALPDHREEHKHNRHRRETTKRRENTQSARAGGCDGTRVRPSAMPPQRLLRMTSSLRDADTKSSNKNASARDWHAWEPCCLMMMRAHAQDLHTSPHSTTPANKLTITFPSTSNSTTHLCSSLHTEGLIAP